MKKNRNCLVNLSWKKNPQSIFSHFDMRDVSNSINQTFRRDRLSRLLTGKRKSCLVEKTQSL